MLRSSLLLALSALPILAGDHARIEPEAVGCDNVIAHEPVLVYEVHGGTLAGPVDSIVTIYGDGAVRWMDVSMPDSPRAAFVQANPLDVAELLLGLERIGGRLNCDDASFGTDLPLHTLTLLRAGTDVRAHTHSWWLPDSSNGVMEQRIEAFLDVYLPEH